MPVSADESLVIHIRTSRLPKSLMLQGLTSQSDNSEMAGM